MHSLIAFFTRRHLLSNVIFFGLMILSFFIWNYIGKEEMPEFESNWVRVSTSYPGAPAEDVELFVSKPMEEELKGVVGIEEVVTVSSVGSSSIRLTLDDDFPDKKEVLQDIKDAVMRTQLPAEVRDLPRIRQFKSSEKAILDIGMYLEGVEKLSDEERRLLQQYVLSFEAQITALNEISSIERSHYRKPELQILVNPNQNTKLQLSLSEIRSQLVNNNVRVPIGSMQDEGESKVTALNELDTAQALERLILRGNYEGEFIRLSEIAHIKDSFLRSTSIFKINGHEAVFLNVRKSISTDILTAQKRVFQFIESFKLANKDSPLRVVFMDDESYAVRNRLDIVTSNGVMGFILIVAVLFLFLNAKSGLWVAMGIPFSMAFTLIICHLIGYTVNNMTLAGIIIVLGIVVDDAKVPTLIFS
jgi:multidrug efflux pump subunit AcrB